LHLESTNTCMRICMGLHFWCSKDVSNVLEKYRCVVPNIWSAWWYACEVFIEQTCEVYIWSFTFWVKNGTASWCYWTISYKTYTQSKNMWRTNGSKRHSIICLIYSLTFIIDKKHTWKRKDHVKNRTLYVFDVRGDVHLCGNGQNH
jgi:hypothetical protein